MRNYNQKLNFKIDLLSIHSKDCHQKDKIITFLTAKNLQVVEVDQKSNNNNNYLPSTGSTFIVRNHIYNQTWSLEFSGETPNLISLFIKIKEFQLHSFFQKETTRISRLDIQYTRFFLTPEESEPTKIYHLFQECQKNFIGCCKSKTPATQLQSKIVKLGSRKSSHYFRIYLRNDEFLKFEIELKNKTTIMKQMTQIFIQNETFNPEELQTVIDNYLLAKMVDFMPIDSLYADWFRHFSRINRNCHDNKLVNFEYFDLSRNEVPPFSKELLYFILQVLSFFKYKKFISVLKKQMKMVFKTKDPTIGEKTFYKVEFRLVDFLDYCRVNSTRRYQIKFFNSIFQTLPLISRMTKTEVSREAVFALFKYRKENHGIVCSLLIFQSALRHLYPYQLTEYFLRAASKYEKEVKVEFCISFASQSRIKTVSIETVFRQLQITKPDNLSNQAIYL